VVHGRGARISAELPDSRQRRSYLLHAPLARSTAFELATRLSPITACAKTLPQPEPHGPPPPRVARIRFVDFLMTMVRQANARLCTYDGLTACGTRRGEAGWIGDSATLVGPSSMLGLVRFARARAGALVVLRAIRGGKATRASPTAQHPSPTSRWRRRRDGGKRTRCLRG
jgi:hypothetical protein